MPLVPAAAALGASFGVLARTAHFDAPAAVLMSATTFGGSAQVAAVSVLGAGGGVAAQLRDRGRVAAAVAGAGIAALLTPFVPPGVPIVAATAAVLVGWRRA